MADFTIKAFDRLPSIQATLSAGGNAVDLTGATVSFIMRPADGGPVKINAAAVVVAAAGGVVRYDWGATDTNTVGDFEAEFEVITGGKARTFPTDAYLDIAVVADLDGAA